MCASSQGAAGSVSDRAALQGVCVSACSLAMSMRLLSHAVHVSDRAALQGVCVSACGLAMSMGSHSHAVHVRGRAALQGVCGGMWPCHEHGIAQPCCAR